MSIGLDFGIGIDENSWYRHGIVSKPKKLASPIPAVDFVLITSNDKGKLRMTNLTHTICDSQHRVIQLSNRR